MFKSVQKSAVPTIPLPRGDEIWATDGGIYQGYLTNTFLGESPPRYERFLYKRDRHIITIGPNGSGKTKRLLVENLVDLRGWSIVVVDPKGELARMTAERRRAYGEVIILNPYDLFGMGSTQFNPIAALDETSDEFIDDAFSLAQAIIVVPPDAKDPHWAESAQDLVTALILYAKLVDKVIEGENTDVKFCDNFGFVRKLLGSSAKEFVLIVQHMMVTAKERNCEELGIKAARFLDVSENSRELNSIISAALTQTRWLDSALIKKDLMGAPFDFATLKDKPVTIYINLPARRIATQAPWMRLMIASIMQKLMKDAGKPKTPTLLMLDEFAQLGPLKAIEDNLAVMRGYGIKLWAVFQDLNQARHLYHERWESFAANAGVLSAFAPQDMMTSNYFEQRSGKIFVEVKTSAQQHSVTDPKAQAVNVTSGGIKDRPVFYSQDLRAMHDGFMVAFSHVNDLTLQIFAPYYTERKDLADLAALDPSI